VPERTKTTVTAAPDGGLAAGRPPPPRAWPVRPHSRGYASGNYDYLIRLRKIDG